MEIIEHNIEKLIQLCKKYKVKSLCVFGSILRNDFSDESDLDFIVDIKDKDPLAYADRYFELKFDLEELFGRTIDLLEVRSLKNNLLKSEIDNTKYVIYE